MEAESEASRARPAEYPKCEPPKRGRKTVVTPDRVQTICELLARGESERSACLRAGIGLTAWGADQSNELAGVSKASFERYRSELVAEGKAFKSTINHKYERITAKTAVGT